MCSPVDGNLKIVSAADKVLPPYSKPLLEPPALAQRLVSARPTCVVAGTAFIRRWAEVFVFSSFTCVIFFAPPSLPVYTKR